VAIHAHIAYQYMNDQTQPIELLAVCFHFPIF